MNRETREKPMRTPPRREGCECARHGRKLAPKFTEEGFERLPCYCGIDTSLRDCQCTFAPWGDSLVAVYVGQDRFFASAEFDLQANDRMYRVGRFLHCVVREQANYTDPNRPPSVALSDYEVEVFGTTQVEPFDLRVPIRRLENHFRRRTMQRHRGVLYRNRRWTDTPEIPVDDPPATSERPFAAGPLTQVILSMPDKAWRKTWKVVFILDVSGLAEDRGDAYDMIDRIDWPTHNRGTTRAHVCLGDGYVRESDLTPDDARDETEGMRRLAERDGPLVLIPLVFTEEEQLKIAEELREKLTAIALEARK